MPEGYLVYGWKHDACHPEGFCGIPKRRTLVILSNHLDRKQRETVGLLSCLLTYIKRHKRETFFTLRRTLWVTTREQNRNLLLTRKIAVCRSLSAGGPWEENHQPSGLQFFPACQRLQHQSQ